MNILPKNSIFPGQGKNCEKNPKNLILMLICIKGRVKKTSTLGTWRLIVFNVLRCMNND